MRMTSRTTLGGTVGLVLLLPGAVAAEPQPEPEPRTLGRQAQAVLEARCYRCHGQGGAVEGGLNYILDLRKLVIRGKVIPGKPNASELLRRVTSRENPMPPPGEPGRPGADEVETLRRWIAAGAPDPRAGGPRRAFLGADDVLALIHQDLLRDTPAPDRRFIRYFTIAHLWNAGLSDDELETYRVALSKLVNSLSWAPRIVPPRPIDPARTVLRIDLRDYRWTPETWARILAQYPHGIVGSDAGTRAVAVASGTELPAVRADWFVASASRPPLYHDVLQLPATERGLERRLRIDVASDIARRRVARAGFSRSGVARNNRLIERHITPFGAYWKSYDFAESVDRRNVFEHPLGPGGSGPRPFRHDYGEILFNLPNGLQAYMVVDDQGRRILGAPVFLASVKNRPDPQIHTGISCMSCHARGTIANTDQVRPLLEQNPHAFTASEAATIRAIYPPEDEMNALLRQDGDRFRRAVARTGARIGSTEPIEALAMRYEEELDLTTAAAEAGLTPNDFLRGVEQSTTLTRALGPLKLAGGTVQRRVFLDAFPKIVRELRLGRLVSPSAPALARGDLARAAFAPAAGANNVNNFAFDYLRFLGLNPMAFLPGAVPQAAPDPEPAPGPAPAARVVPGTAARFALLASRLRPGEAVRLREPAARAQVEPDTVLLRKAAVADLTPSPDRRWLFLLDRSDGKLRRIDAARRTLDRLAVEIGDDATGLSLSPDGGTLYAFGPREVKVLDPETLQVRDSIDPPILPFDAEADDAGRLFLSGVAASNPNGNGNGNSFITRNVSNSNGSFFFFYYTFGGNGGGNGAVSSAASGEIVVFDPARRAVLDRLPTGEPGTVLALHPSQVRLYASGPAGPRPGRIVAIPLDRAGRSEASERGGNRLGGRFQITPDGGFLIASTGTVLRLARQPSEDLRFAAKVAPHLAAVVDPDARRLLVATPDGSLKVYTYPQFRETRSVALGALAYRLALDPATHTLYAAVADDSTLQGPTLLGQGELRAYDLDALERPRRRP